jgi:hypothetical protein
MYYNTATVLKECQDSQDIEGLHAIFKVFFMQSSIIWNVMPRSVVEYYKSVKRKVLLPSSRSKLSKQQTVCLLR